MKLLVEPFTSLSGWTSDGSISAALLNEHREFIADQLAASVVFHVPAGSSGKYVTKTVAVNAAGYEELVLSAWSRRRARTGYGKPADFSYKIAVEGTKEFYLPAFPSLTDVTIHLGGLTALNRVRVTALHDEEDDLLLSACYAVHDEFPLDIMTALQGDLATLVAARYGAGLQVGTVRAVVGDERVVVAGARDFLDRYAVVSFGAEIHQVDLIDEEGLTFMPTYSGRAVLAAQANVPVYLQIPVVFGTTEKEAAIPSIALWAASPEHVARSTDIERSVDSFDVAGDFQDRREAQTLRYRLMVDAEARHWEILAGLNVVVRRMLGRNYLWVNARKYDLEWDQAPQDVEPELPVETVPKTQYVLDIEVKEPREDRQTLVPAGAADVNYYVRKGTL